MGGGGGGQTQQKDQYQSISPWAQPYVTSVLGAAQKQVFNTDEAGNITGIAPYTAYGIGGAGQTPEQLQAAQSSVAGFSPLQQQAFQGASELQTPGQFGTATNLGTAAGYGALGTTGEAGMYGGMGARAGQQAARQSSMYGGMGADIGRQAAGQSNLLGGMAIGQGQQGAQIGQSLGQMSTSPGAVQAYMNPYIQASLQPQLNLLAQQTGIQSAAQQGAATSAGAFGGSRSALQNALIQQAGNLAAQQAIGQGYSNAYQQAIAQMNAANQAALAGNQQAQAGITSGLNAAQQAGQLGLAGTQQGLAGAQQAGQLGISGAQAGLSGVGAQQAGYGQAGTAGTNLANIGAGQLAAQQGILNLQNQYGTQQQQQQQNIINQAMQNYQTAQQYPQQQLNFLNSLITGKPMTDVTTTLQQPAPNMGSQLMGAGAVASGLGSYRDPMGPAIGMKKGGKVKGYDVGGSVEQDLEDLDTEALKHEAANSPSQEVRKQAAAILARDRMQEGITGLKSRLAFSDGGILNAQYGNADSDDGYAGGGIVAFAGGGKSDVNTMSNTDVMGNILSYMNDPRYMALAQPDEERQAILQDIKDARAKAAAAQDNFLGRALIAGGAKAMSGASPFGMVNLGEGITSGLGEYSAQEKTMEDQLNKLRQGRLDLSKLTSEERKNLLHYATTAAGTQEQVEARREGIKSREQMARDAAAARALTSGIAKKNEAAALAQKIYDRDIATKAKELGTTIDGMTSEQKDEFMREAINRANILLEATGKKTMVIPGKSNPSGTTVDFSKLPK